MSLTEFCTNIKTAAAVAGTTLSTSVGTVVAWIPEGIGKLGTLVGIVLSLVLIYTHLRKSATDHARAMLEIKVLKQKARKKRARW